jgi:integrase
MARTVRNSTLDNRTARLRLRPSGKPVFRLIEPGLHIGYRRLTSGPGTWVARRYCGDGSYRVTNLVTDAGRPVFADDYSDGDGLSVLTFAQAQERTKALRPAGTEQPERPFTVADAMADYFAFLELHRKPTRTARSHDRLFIGPSFGTTNVAQLTADRIRRWLSDIASQAPRVRMSAKPDGSPKPPARSRPVSVDEAARRRQATANRILTTLKAALNRAWREGKTPSDNAWRRVEPFHGVETARVRYLTIAEGGRLSNACEADFRKIVTAALVSGARYGQLTRLIASDFNAENGTLRLYSRKGRGREHVYHAVLTAEGTEFFGGVCAGSPPEQLMFRKADGAPWNTSDHSRPMMEACQRAGISPPAGIHVARHTWASHAVMNGMPIMVVARNLGHSDTRMVEKHYGHLAPSYIADQVRKSAPQFGFSSGNVTALRA